MIQPDVGQTAKTTGPGIMEKRFLAVEAELMSKPIPVTTTAEVATALTNLIRVVDFCEKAREQNYSFPIIDTTRILAISKCLEALAKTTPKVAKDFLNGEKQASASAKNQALYAACMDRIIASGDALSIPSVKLDESIVKKLFDVQRAENRRTDTTNSLAPARPPEKTTAEKVAEAINVDTHQKTREEARNQVIRDASLQPWQVNSSKGLFLGSAVLLTLAYGAAVLGRGITVPLGYVSIPPVLTPLVLASAAYAVGNVSKWALGGVSRTFDKAYTAGATLATLLIGREVLVNVALKAWGEFNSHLGIEPTNPFSRFIGYSVAGVGLFLIARQAAKTFRNGFEDLHESWKNKIDNKITKFREGVPYEPRQIAGLLEPLSSQIASDIGYEKETQDFLRDARAKENLDDGVSVLSELMKEYRPLDQRLGFLANHEMLNQKKRGSKFESKLRPQLPEEDVELNFKAQLKMELLQDLNSERLMSPDELDLKLNNDPRHDNYVRDNAYQTRHHGLEYEATRYIKAFFKFIDAVDSVDKFEGDPSENKKPLRDYLFSDPVSSTNSQRLGTVGGALEFLAAFLNDPDTDVVKMREKLTPYLARDFQSAKNFKEWSESTERKYPTGSQVQNALTDLLRAGRNYGDRSNYVNKDLETDLNRRLEKIANGVPDVDYHGRAEKSPRAVIGKGNPIRVYDGVRNLITNRFLRNIPGKKLSAYLSPSKERKEERYNIGVKHAGLLGNIRFAYNEQPNYMQQTGGARAQTRDGILRQVNETLAEVPGRIRIAGKIRDKHAIHDLLARRYSWGFFKTDRSLENIFTPTTEEIQKAGILVRAAKKVALFAMPCCGAIGFGLQATSSFGTYTALGVAMLVSGFASHRAVTKLDDKIH